MKKRNNKALELLLKKNDSIEMVKQSLLTSLRENGIELEDDVEIEVNMSFVVFGKYLEVYINTEHGSVCKVNSIRLNTYNRLIEYIEPNDFGLKSWKFDCVLMAASIYKNWDKAIDIIKEHCERYRKAVLFG